MSCFVGIDAAELLPMASDLSDEDGYKASESSNDCVPLHKIVDCRVIFSCECGTE